MSFSHCVHMCTLAHIPVLFLSGFSFWFLWCACSNFWVGGPSFVFIPLFPPRSGRLLMSKLYEWAVRLWQSGQPMMKYNHILIQSAWPVQHCLHHVLISTTHSLPCGLPWLVKRYICLVHPLDVSLFRLYLCFVEGRVNMLKKGRFSTPVQSFQAKHLFRTKMLRTSPQEGPD